MDRNVKVLFVAGLLSALILGVFELLFPFYLSYRGISLVEMGLIFSISTLAVSFLRIFVGAYSDVHGRKRVYITSSTLGVASKSIFPFSAGELEILANKFMNDLEESLRASVHNIMLYENTRKDYAKLFSRFTATNFILQAAGNLSFGILLLHMGYSGSFYLLATVEVAIFVIILSYREDRKGKDYGKVSLREAYSFKIGKNLRVLALSSAIGALGFGIAHGFLLPLYFAGKYGLDAAEISVITAIHRLSFLTTPLSDKVIRRLGIRRTYVFSTLAYAVSFLSVGLITFPILIFVPLFLIHDLLGGGIRMTATNVIVQSLTSDRRRGREVNAFDAIQTPMSIIAPSIAGTLATQSWDLTFVTGGMLYVVSLFVFYLFFKEDVETGSPKGVGQSTLFSETGQ